MDTHIVVVLAEGVPPDSPVAILAVPIGIAVFLGSIFLLVRSNLGSLRGYLVTATSFFGFMLIFSLFWTFGAPGTPQATGPQNLPGQPPDHYQPTWTPFADTSRIAELPEYADIIEGYPDTFEPVPPEFEDEAENGAGEIESFFSEPEHGGLIEDVWEVEETLGAVSPSGFPVIATTFSEVDEETLEPVEDGETVTLFAFFDEGAELFPGFVFIGAALVLFALHASWLFRVENEERHVAEIIARQAEQDRQPAGV